MPDTLDLDYETRSLCNLKQAGLGRYVAPSSQTSVLMASYSIDHGPVRQWRVTDGPFPKELREALLDPHVEKWGFASQFERVVTRDVLGIDTPYKGWRCAQVLAYMHSFMGGLDEITTNVGLPLDFHKQKRGNELIGLFCMPQRQTTHRVYEWRNWITDPEEWEEFCDYNLQDTIAEMGLKTRLSPYPIPDIEWEYYEMDQEINDRGMPVDPIFVNKIILLAAKRKDELVAMMNRITGLANSNSGAQLLPWLRERGYRWSDLQKPHVETALRRQKEGLWCMTAEAVRVLELRQWASRTSTGKADKAFDCVSPDGQARYLFQFVGAGRTGRESGRLIQPQNLMRTPSLLDVDDHGPERLEVVTETIRAGEYDMLSLLVEEPMLGLTGCMRSMFRAPDGSEMLSVDLASIESVGLGYLSRCERLLDVFRNGKDVYKDFGAAFYRVSYDAVTKQQRQICKPPALGCGYRLSAGYERDDGTKTGLMAYAENMGIPLTQDEADHAVTVYRQTYVEVVQFWRDLEIASRECVMDHQPRRVGYLTFEWKRPYLLLRLPSGRCIYYYKPVITPEEVHTGRYRTVRRQSRSYFEDGYPEGTWFETQEEETYWRQVLSYMGRDHTTNKWVRLKSHGGLLCENAVQAFTRDILFTALHRLHKKGYPLIGHAHDEGIAVVRKGSNQFTLREMVEVFKQPIEWAPGIPLGAAGWQGQFYRK